MTTTFAATPTVKVTPSPTNPPTPGNHTPTMQLQHHKTQLENMLDAMVKNT